jgi:hypothetical protein
MRSQEIQALINCKTMPESIRIQLKSGPPPGSRIETRQVGKSASKHNRVGVEKVDGGSKTARRLVRTEIEFASRSPDAAASANTTAPLFCRCASGSRVLGRRRGRSTSQIKPDDPSNEPSPLFSVFMGNRLELPRHCRGNSPAV